MSTYAIPMYLYVTANTLDEAKSQRGKLEKLLANPFVKIQLQNSGIVDQGFRVLDPLPSPSK